MSGVARSYQSTENYQPLSPLWSSSEFQLIVQLSETQLYCFISSLSFLGAWQNIDMMISLNPMIHYQYTFLKMGLMLAATLWLSCQTLWNQDAAILFAFFFFFFFTDVGDDGSRQAESLYLDIIFILIVSYHELHECHSHSYSFCHCVLH